MSAHIRDNAHFAKTVLMPGDPLRAKYICENYLADYELVTDIRGILGFTGHTKEGKEISVMASGMGCPSIGIYSYELFNNYGVENIIRIGTCGSYKEDVHVGDLILVSSAFSNSAYASQFKLPEVNIAATSSFELLDLAYNNAKKLNIPVKVGPIYSSDIFYEFENETRVRLAQLGVLGVEMESYALFINAMILNKKALCICTVSDALVSAEKGLSVEQRQTMLVDMFKLGISLA